MAIQLKRAYEAAAREDGYRVLVDGMWPRGVAKKDAALDEWCKQLAPSSSLRRWFGHDRERWSTFRSRYIEELGQADSDIIRRLASKAANPGLTLVFAARDTEYNNAVVIKEYLEKHARNG